MLSVAKLTPGQEGYYERSVALGLDDYYAGRGESPGIWVGRGASELELDGVVGEGELGRLIRGRDPHTGEVLRRHYRPRRITIERIDPFSGDRSLEVKKLAPVAGFDLVFSPPKSVSLLHALGDEQTRRAVNEAHVAAWQAALAYLEDEACVTRRGRNGVHREHAGGFVAAAYQHRTSRAQDPHLHTHVIVANMAKSPSDGKWRALDGEPILKSYRLAAGYLYQAQLRAELTSSLGVEWEQPHKGMAELRGVPRSVIRAFSTRRAQVVEELARRGGGGFYAAQLAAVETRERKEQVDLVGLREDWRARAAELGLGRRELRALLGRVHQSALSRSDLLRIARRLLGPEGLTERQDGVLRTRGSDGLGAGARYRRLCGARPAARRASRPHRRRRAGGRAAESGPPGPLLDRRADPPRAGGSGACRARPRHRRPCGRPAAGRRDRAQRPCRPHRGAGADGRRSHHGPQPSRSASSDWPAPARRPPPTPSPPPSHEQESRCSVRRRPESPPRSSRTRPASNPPRCTACSNAPAPRAAFHIVVC